MERLGLFFHLDEARVVVGELVEVRQRNLAGEERVVSGYISDGVGRAVLKLDVHTHSELLHIEAPPVDAELLADFAGLLAGEV